jgi:hypothetical protein
MASIGLVGNSLRILKSSFCPRFAGFLGRRDSPACHFRRAELWVAGSAPNHSAKLLDVCVRQDERAPDSDADASTLAGALHGADSAVENAGRV